MFNFLKRKLFGVEKKLEEALEAKIESELAKERKAPAPAANAPPTTAPAAPAAPKPAPQQPVTTAPAREPPPAPSTRPPAPPPSHDNLPRPPLKPMEAPPPSHENLPPPPLRPMESPPPSHENLPPPPPRAPTPSAPPPGGYREAKRLGALEEAQRKKETVEERLERELAQAVETQKVIEKVGGEGERITLPPDQLEDLLWDLELGLLEADVALPVIEAIKASVREQLTVTGVRRKNAHAMVEEVLRTAITRVLQVGKLDFDAFVRERLQKKKPVVLMFVGVNGTGKTTTIAKLAHRLKGLGISSVLAAGDTFRAGAIEQLTQHADRLGVRIIKHGPGADPAAVAFDAIEHAKSRAKDVVLLDTAGRMQTNTNLMAEMAKIRRVAQPDLVIFVGDSLAGNDAVTQAQEFERVVRIDGVILTKVDADAKGGAALSVAYTIQKPLLFVGIGQEYDQQIPFDAKWMVDRLFSGDGAEAAAAE